MDLDRLKELFKNGTLLEPCWFDNSEYGQMDLANTLKKWNGIEGSVNNNLEERMLNSANVNEIPRIVVFVIIDTLGYNSLQSNLPDQSFLKKHCIGSLRTGFPTSTFPMMSMLISGFYPGDSGAVFSRLFHSLKGPIYANNQIEYFPKVENWVSLSKRKVHLSYTKRCGPWFKHWGLDCETYIVPGDNLDDDMSKISDYILSLEKSSDPTFLIVYSDDLIQPIVFDNTEMSEVIGNVNSAIEKLSIVKEALGSDIMFVVSSDHGISENPIAQPLDFDEEILSLITCYHGDKKFILFQVPEKNHQKFEEVFRSKLGEHAVLLSVKNTSDIHLFTPNELPKRSIDLLGDYVALIVNQNRFNINTNGNINRSHSGLSPDEMQVPLVVF